MKTEISRDSHQSEKRYTGVYQQQGRMLTDSDWNELVDILKEHLNEALRDVVGGKQGSIGGTPRHRRLRIVDGTARIQPGHIYIDGVAARVPGDVNIDFDGQPDFPGPPAPVGDYVLYADVWERAVTHLMDGRLRDKGLHGADTCSRKQMLAQIKWCPNSIDPEQTAHNPGKGDAELTLTLLQKTADPDACDPCAAELDIETRIGNYLFRVEVHDVQGDADDPNEITLKWSSENGAEQFQAMPNKDDMPAGFISDKWVYEFFDQTTERHLGVHLDNTVWQPSRVGLKKFSETSSSYSVPSIPGSSESQTLIRRWDGYCRLNLTTGVLLEGMDRGVELSTAKAADSLGYVNIGASLEIVLNSLRLQLELTGKSFVAGDFWLADVREAEHSEGSVLLDNQLAHGIRHHYLTLGSVTAGVLQANPEIDRKYAFPPLTEMTRLLMAGGDGQEIEPGQPLPQPLRVGVANGEWPVVGATVRFQIEAGGGTLSVVNSGLTNADGIAECVWTPGAVLGATCRVKASLVDPDHSADPTRDLEPPVYFYANLISADQVAYAPACQPGTLESTVHHLLLGPDGARLGSDGYYTVKEILDALLCELKADHVPYDAPVCNTNTVKTLLVNLDFNSDGLLTVKDVLDTLLCKLWAQHVPYDPIPKQSRWDDINEEDGTGRPTTVQQAIDALLANLHSEDILYKLPDCGLSTNTIKGYLQSLIEHDSRDDTGSFRIDAMWDALLCHLDAAKLPYDASLKPHCWQAVNIDSGVSAPQTVQQAIDNLACVKGDGCCGITIRPEDDIQQKLSEIGDSQDVEICFKRGDHQVKDTLLLQNKRHVSIYGCGPESRILAPNSESVIRIRNCKSVSVHDIAMLSSQAGDKAELKHLGGTLDILDVESVMIDRIVLTCPAAPAERSASCLTIAYSQPDYNNRTSVHVQRSQLNPGGKQIGMLMINAGRAHIEDNEIRVRAKSSHWSLVDKLKEKEYRRGFRNILISNIAFSMKSSVSGVMRNSFYNFKDQGVTLYFATDETLVEAWQTYLGNHPPAENADRFALVKHLQTLADEVLLSQGKVDGIDAFENWYVSMASNLPAIAHQGIVCAGRSAGDIRILNNSIVGAVQGVHIGLSHDEAMGYQSDSAGRVQIRGNHITVYLSAENNGARHGIYVGNCNSLDIESNYINAEYFPVNKTRLIEGIRIYGFMGKMILVRHNHCNGFSTGVLIRVLNPTEEGDRNIWQVVSNMLEGSQSKVDIVPYVFFLEEHNA